MSKTVSPGVVHKVPTDLRKALMSDGAALAIWEDLTPLARNEWICWITSVKKDETRKEHINRTVSELKEGIRRPCCWLGCIHRKDKSISPSVQAVLNRRSKKSNRADCWRTYPEKYKRKNASNRIFMLPLGSKITDGVERRSVC